MKVWWILFYLSLYIYNRQIYISAQYFKQFFVGKGINSGTLLPPHGAETMRGWVDSIAWLLLRELRKLLPSHSILPLSTMKFSNTVFTCIFDRVYMADSVMVRSVMRYGAHQGEWVCTQGHDPFPKHNHSSVSLFGYFSFWLLQCPITRHRTKQQIKTRSLGTGCGDILGGGQLIEKNLDDET